MVACCSTLSLHCTIGGGPDPNPELRLERGDGNQENYLSVRQNHEISHFETTASRGFHFEYSSSHGSAPAVMASITPEGTGICTADPKATLDVLVGERGEFEVFPNNNDSASVRLTSLQNNDS